MGKRNRSRAAVAGLVALLSAACRPAGPTSEQSTEASHADQWALSRQGEEPRAEDLAQQRSQLLAEIARQLSDRHDYSAARLFALAGLPRDGSLSAEAAAGARGQLLRAELNDPLRRTFAGHADTVRHVALSPDGLHMATASVDATVRVWDLATGTTLLTIGSHGPLPGYRGLKLDQVFYSPDGARIVTLGNEGLVLVWDAATGDEALRLEGHREAVNHVEYSPDGTRILTASEDGDARLWDSTTGESLAVMRGMSACINFGGSGPPTVREGACFLSTEFSSRDGEVDYAAFSPDGSTIVVTSQTSMVATLAELRDEEGPGAIAELWDVSTGEKRATLAGHAEAIPKAAFSPDGNRVVTASWDMTAKVWDVASGALLFTLEGHQRGLTNVAFSPDGSRILTASGDGTAKLWDAQSGALVDDLADHRADAGPYGQAGVSHVAFSADGRRIATASGDGTARLWDAQSGEELIVFGGHDEGVTYVAFTKDGTQLLTASGDGTAKLWDATRAEDVLEAATSDGVTVLPSRDDIRIVAGEQENVTHASISPDGRRAITGAQEGEATLWDAISGRRIAELFRHDGRVNVTAFSPDSRIAASGTSDGEVRLYDADTGDFVENLRDPLVEDLRGHASAVIEIVFGADGSRMLTTGTDGARLWDVATGELIATFAPERSTISHAELSPDETRVLTAGSDGMVRIRDAMTGADLIVLPHTSDVRRAAFSPDGTRVATGSHDHKVRLWDAASGELIRVFEGHWSVVWGVAFSPDGARLVTGAEDSDVRLWDVATGLEIASLTPWASAAVERIVFSPEGAVFFTEGWSGGGQLWDAASGAELLHSLLTYDFAAYTDDGAAIFGVDGVGAVRTLDPRMRMTADELAEAACQHAAERGEASFTLEQRSRYPLLRGLPDEPCSRRSG